jgi:hypothetical protein
MLFPLPPGIHPEKVSPPAAGIGFARQQTASREKFRVQPTGVETVNLAVRVLLQKTGGLQYLRLANDSYPAVASW